MNVPSGNGKIQWRGRHLWAFLIVAGLFLLLFWQLGSFLWNRLPALLALMEDEAALESTAGWLGWLGPLGVIFFNALQIVLAPIPAYGIFAVAGFLYGPVWGGVYGSIGTLLGATLAMMLTRRFGRPLAVRMVGQERLEKWDRVTNSHSTLLWAILLLAPVGDVPYFLAGLSSVNIPKVLVLTLLIRIPTVFLVTAAASGATFLSWWQLTLIILGLLVLFGLLIYHQDRLLAWFEGQIQKRLHPKVSSSASDEHPPLSQ